MNEKVKFYTQAFSLIIICSVLLVIYKQSDSFVNVNNMVDSQGYQINSPLSIPMATSQVPSADVAAVGAAAGSAYTPQSSYTGSAILDTTFGEQAKQLAQAQAAQAQAQAQAAPVQAQAAAAAAAAQAQNRNR